jgi:hypothetical protein
MRQSALPHTDERDRASCEAFPNGNAAIALRECTLWWNRCNARSRGKPSRNSWGGSGSIVSAAPSSTTPHCQLNRRRVLDDHVGGQQNWLIEVTTKSFAAKLVVQKI